MTRQADDYPLVSKAGLLWTALPGPRPLRVRPCVGRTAVDACAWRVHVAPHADRYCGCVRLL